MRVVAVGDQAVDELVSIDRAERRIRGIGNIAEIGVRLVASFLQILLVLVLAEIVVF